MNNIEYIKERGSSGSSVPDYSPKGTGFEPHARRPLLGSPSLNGYRSMTGNLNTAKEGTGHPNSLCRWPNIMGVAVVGLRCIVVKSSWLVLIMVSLSLQAS